MSWRLSYLGPAGTYSEEAALAWAGRLGTGAEDPAADGEARNRAGGPLQEMLDTCRRTL